MSADPVPARLPYGVITKLVMLIDWKRFEMNSLIKFTGITEGNFDSIFRRGWCCMLKARFLSPERLAQIPGASKKGFFLKRPTLKEELSSPAFVTAMLNILHGFRMQHTPAQCYQIIEDYVQGGDGGVTRRLMRAASDLPDEEMQVDPAESFDPVGQAKRQLQSDSDEIALAMLDNGIESITRNVVAKLMIETHASLSGVKRSALPSPC